MAQRGKPIQRRKELVAVVSRLAVVVRPVRDAVDCAVRARGLPRSPAAMSQLAVVRPVREAVERCAVGARGLPRSPAAMSQLAVVRPVREAVERCAVRARALPLLPKGRSWSQQQSWRANRISSKPWVRSIGL